MSRYAAIDIGTNSMKMCVSQIEGGEERVLLDRVLITRLGEGLHESGRIGREAAERNIAAFLELVEAGRELGVDRFAAVGTMALRSASNGKEFTDRAAKESGVEIEVISGEEEARLSFLAFVSGLGPGEGEVCVFDTGGGSTEFTYGRGDRIKRRLSLSVGSRRMTEQFLLSDPASREELDELVRFLDGALVDLSPGVDLLVGMGGTVTSLGSVMHRLEKYDQNLIQGAVLSLDEVEKQIEMFLAMSIEERKKVTGLMPKRADVILAGASIVRGVMKKLEAARLVISDRGLRHGLLYDRFPCVDRLNSAPE